MHATTGSRAEELPVDASMAKGDAMLNSSVISTRRVTFEMQEQFATFSGDRNAMHMDPVAARRTQAGAPVVHGMHTLLWALECLVEARIIVSQLVRIRLKFPKWLYVEHESTLVLPFPERFDPSKLQVESSGLCVMVAELFYGVLAAQDSATPPSASPAAPQITAADHSFGNLGGREGVAYTATEESAGAHFPALAEYLTGSTVAEIAACSYIVGMEVPGLHSMFSKLDLVIWPVNPVRAHAGLRYRVSAHDERFRKARIEVTGPGISGTLEAFLRLPPVEQSSMHRVRDLVPSREFMKMHALIVGGSRGLGELTAKLIAAGGGSSTITYAVGRADAERVAVEIREEGGTIDILPYDVRQKPAPQLARLKSSITHVFYFATNSIFRPKEDLVSHPILMDFVTYYLQGFHDLCVELLKPGLVYSHKGLCVYYPSSVAVEERPAGMTEYSMVKAAGEQMCRDMNQFLPGIRVLTTRLPRLPTDQTASVMPGREMDPVSVLLPIVREMNELILEPDGTAF
jgi:NADP-dependent 3-hydroxy acid dehydrogenase YdfG